MVKNNPVPRLAVLHLLDVTLVTLACDSVTSRDLGAREREARTVCLTLHACGGAVFVLRYAKEARTCLIMPGRRGALTLLWPYPAVSEGGGAFLRTYHFVFKSFRCCLFCFLGSHRKMEGRFDRSVDLLG